MIHPINGHEINTHNRFRLIIYFPFSFRRSAIYTKRGISENHYIRLQLVYEKYKYIYKKKSQIASANRDMFVRMCIFVRLFFLQKTRKKEKEF